MKKRRLLTTGEFAKLCKTTKETLFHYDRANILKPKHVSDNGYRYYEITQFFEFDIISTLKDTGSSLREIKTYFQDTDINQLSTVLERKKSDLNREIRKLVYGKLLLKEMLRCLQELSTATYDTLTISRQPEELLELFKIEKCSLGREFSIIDSLCSCAEYYEKRQRIPQGPFGIILGKGEDSQYSEWYLFSRGTLSTPENRLHRKSEGMYASFMHRGTFESHATAFENFMADIMNSGLSISGNVYVFDMMAYSIQSSETLYTQKYSVMVNK